MSVSDDLEFQPHQVGIPAMRDIPDHNAPTEVATIDVMAAAMVERFGEGAAALATGQLAAAHAAGDGIADRWLSIFLSIEDRLGRGRSEPSLGAGGAHAGGS